MIFKRENIYFLFIIFIIFFLDRYSKHLALGLLENDKYIFINNYLNLNLVFNSGIGFGLLSLNAGIYYNILSIFITLIILILFYFMFKSKTSEKIFFSFIIGGAIGNLYDRIFFKAVPDQKSRISDLRPTVIITPCFMDRSRSRDPSRHSVEALRNFLDAAGHAKH